MRTRATPRSHSNPSDASLARQDAIDAGVALQALAHPGRRRLLELVWDVERSSSELAERAGMARPATSQHLRVLREARIVSMRTDGHRRMYRARADTMAELRTFFERFWGSRLDALERAVEAKARDGHRPRRG